LLVLALVLAVATGALVFRLLSQVAQAAPAAVVAPTATPLPTKPIPVAARELGVGLAITTTDIVMRQYPVDLLPVGVLTDTNEIAGQTIVEAVRKGEFFRASQFRGGADRPASEEITPKMVAMAFSRDDLLNKSRVINEGDYVDLLLTLDVKEESATETREGKATNYTLQNIKVLRIVRDKPTEQNVNPEPTAILFEMTPQEAVIAKFVKDSGGTVDFTLRSPADTKPFTTEAINQDFLLDQYGLKAPRSSASPKQGPQ
jgi:pilus assembly protein CpaB